MNINNKKAISLVEILVATLIFTVILAGLYTAFATGNQSWNKYENNITLQRAARGALTSMSKELREASNITITQDSSSATISFNRPKISSSISYTWTTTGIDANRIIRSDSTTTKVLGQNISALSFTDFTNAIEINITANKTQTAGPVSSFNLKEKVAIR